MVGLNRPRRHDKTLLKTTPLGKVTGLSRAQLTRLIRQHAQTAAIRLGCRAPSTAYRGGAAMPPTQQH